jgi:hypothetical protein
MRFRLPVRTARDQAEGLPLRGAPTGRDLDQPDPASSALGMAKDRQHPTMREISTNALADNARPLNVEHRSAVSWG